MVQKYELKGHKAPVTCLAHSSSVPQHKKSLKTGNSAHDKKSSTNPSTPSPCCLLSGSEDGSIRLWDLRSNPSRASLCIVSPKRQEVTSVAFHPIMYNDLIEPSNVGGSKDDYRYPFTIFCSVGSSVYGYDLRNATSPIIRDFDFQVTTLEGGEEINQIQLMTHQATKRIYMASADDDGRARVTDQILNRKISTSSQAPSNKILLQHDTSGSGLVTSLAFRPKAKNVDLATGGTDCTICLWDVHRPKRPSSTLAIQRDDEEDGMNQICNPPFVNSLAWSPSGRLLLTGLGDGTAVVMEVDGRKLVEKCRLRGGHDAAVASVLFPQFGGVNSKHIVAEDRLMVTGGNDGSIFLWDLGKNLAYQGVDPSTMFVDCMHSSSSGNVENNSVEVDDAMKALSLSTTNSHDPTILFGVQHGKKPNFIESSRASNVAFPSSLFVADTSNDITVYTFPRI